ncbi:hypothetical protein B0W47_00585 [Komagataeibacter nataicola]|uniref:Uncharacterized protein n=1 Tax=Komagataeibacter nataicola TaxID=265960 RepID=A0A9N7CJA2_9PROT|nr:hypothetical protein B0W47_00585 [Komagataeibacter nataicola]PYD65333.1 hypothetical protein CDI09_14090 [Komagataeibacter nataicola]
MTEGTVDGGLMLGLPLCARQMFAIGINQAQIDMRRDALPFSVVKALRLPVGDPQQSSNTVNDFLDAEPAPERL